MKTTLYIPILIIAFCVSCGHGQDSLSVLGIGDIKYTDTFESSERLSVDSSFVYNVPTLSLKVVDTLIFTDVLQSKTGMWQVMTSDWVKKGRLLDKGHGRGEFNMSPKVYASQFEQRVDTLFGYVYDFGTGNVCEIDITNSLLYGKLKYRELGYKVPKHLDRYIYMSESEYLMCRNNYGKEHLKKWILCKDGKTVKNDALEQVNAIKINTGDHNVLATLSEYNRKHDVLVQTYMYFNIINIIGVHSGKCVTVCNGEAGIGLDGIIRNRHGKDYYYGCKTYDDVFAVLCIKDKSNPSIQIYSYDGVPVKELVLAKPATSFDFDFARGWLYTYDAEEGVVARYKADIV